MKKPTALIAAETQSLDLGPRVAGWWSNTCHAIAPFGMRDSADIMTGFSRDSR